MQAKAQIPVNFPGGQQERLASLLRLLVLPGQPWILDAGCGAGADWAVYRAAYPAARIVGLDRDGGALRRAGREADRVQADLKALPFGAGFDLVLARHPDLDRRRDSWARFLVEAPVKAGGLLLVSAYALPEIEQARDWLRGAPTWEALPLAVERLAPPGLMGRDRFSLVYRRASG